MLIMSLRLNVCFYGSLFLSEARIRTRQKGRTSCRTLLVDKWSSNGRFHKGAHTQTKCIPTRFGSWRGYRYQFSKSLGETLIDNNTCSHSPRTCSAILPSTRRRKREISISRLSNERDRKQLNQIVITFICCSLPTTHVSKR